MIEKIKAETIGLPAHEEGEVGTEYATPWLFQLKTVAVRTMRSFWRQADYGFT